jgi:hypothetical protein
VTPCSACGCCWGVDGFYSHDGEIVQPCKECRKDAKSIYYLNNRDSILEAQRTAYYRSHEARKAYYREYRRAQRAATV